MKKIFQSKFIIIVNAFIFFAPISFPISLFIIRSTVKRFNKLTAIEKRRLEKKRDSKLKFRSAMGLVLINKLVKTLDNLECLPKPFASLKEKNP